MEDGAGRKACWLTSSSVGRINVYLSELIKWMRTLDISLCLGVPFSVPIIMNAIEMTLQVPGSVIVLNQNGKQI